MAITKCRECGGQVSTEADDCPHCGCENPAKSRFLIRKILGLLVVVGVIAALVQVGGRLSDLPGCEVSGVEITPDSFFTDGKLDAGFTMSAGVGNLAEDQADFQIVAQLSTSEGNFERTQQVTLSPGVPRTLRYGFHEPTVNARNVQGKLSCRAL